MPRTLTIQCVVEIPQYMTAPRCDHLFPQFVCQYLALYRHGTSRLKYGSIIRPIATPCIISLQQPSSPHIISVHSIISVWHRPAPGIILLKYQSHLYQYWKETFSGEDV